MKNSMQTHRGEVGHVRHAGPTSLSGSESQRGKRAQKNIAGATGAKRKTGSIGLLGSRVHYREDDVIGIAWCDIEF